MIAGVPPLAYGLAAIWDPGLVVSTARTLSGARVELSPQMAYLVRVLGLYILMFGVLLLGCVRDPARSGIMIRWAGALLLLRGIQRMGMTATLEDLFGIPPGANALHAIYLLVIGGALIRMAPCGSSEPPAADRPGTP